MTHLYDDTGALARSLADAGLGRHAEQLLAALSEGSTGTEIFMILRLRLCDVIDDGAVPPEYKGEAAGLRDIVVDALK
ncbi:hypothetical protein ABH944_008599 [Caballeronia udeis]|uniref:Uncharacterized protein n=1 Tax=Caballeronia udeis TaxID=1232866 RepID=A0ABW8N1A9_9BURK